MKRGKKGEITKQSTVGYIRTSNSEQIVMNQKLEVLEYCRTHNLNIDRWIISEILSSQPLNKRTKELLSLPKDSILVVTEISKLGKSTSETIRLVNEIMRNGVRIIFTKQGFDLDPTIQGDIATEKVVRVFSVLACLEKDIISLRTSEALSVKKKYGLRIGKIRGTIQGSIYDTKKEQILFLLSKKISVLDISKIIGIGKPRSLLIYLNKRKLREGKRARESNK